MLIRKVFLQLRSRVMLLPAEHEVGLRGHNFYCLYLAKPFAKALCLMQVRTANQLVMLQQILARLYGQ